MNDMNDIEGYGIMAASLKAELGPSVRKGIVLLRSGTAAPLDGPGDSYFGGLPRLPPDFEWPQLDEHTHKRYWKVPRVLSFLAQIRLDDLPHVPGREALPSTGTLYFFIPTEFVGDESQGCQVLFYPGSERFPERAPPDNLPRLEGYGWQELPKECWRSVEFRYPIRFAIVDTYLDCKELGSYDCVRREPHEKMARWVAEILFENFRAAAVTAALGPPPSAKYDDCGYHQILARAEEDRTWVAALQESLPEARGLPQPQDWSNHVALCCYYANLCCQLGKRDQVPALWLELLEERASWVDRGDAYRPFKSNCFEMHQMLGNWRHTSHCRFLQDREGSAVLLLQVDRSEQLVLNHSLGDSVLHFAISAEALACRDFSAVRLYD